MSRSARWSVAIVFIVLLCIGMLTQGEDMEQTMTSYGSVPGGYGALYELLEKLSVSQGRSFGQGASLPEDATVWWIAPKRLCAGVEEGDLSGAKSGVWRSLDWIASGGTGVVFLPNQPLTCLEDIVVAEFPVPTRLIDLDSSDDDLGASSEESEDAAGENYLFGTLAPEPRSMEESHLRYFERSLGYEVLVQDPDRRPFAVARQLGEGRIVFVSTPSPLMNHSIGEGDAALLAVDLAVGLGAPFIDEREHGILPSPDAIPYLLSSAAAPAFIGAAILVLAAIWRERAQIAPRLQPDSALPPTMEEFVASIATLYSGTRDYPEVLRCYQEFIVSQIRRSLLMPSDMPERQVFARVRSLRSLTEEDLLPLEEMPTCRRASELHEKVARLDALAASILR